jgi:chromosome segregation ATPase
LSSFSRRAGLPWRRCFARVREKTASGLRTCCSRSGTTPQEIAVDAKSSLGDAESSLGDAESSLGDAESSLGDAKSSLGDAESSLGDAKSSLDDAKSSLGDAESSLGDAKSSLDDAKSSLGDAESSLGDAKSSLGDAESSLGDAKSSLGELQRTAALDLAVAEAVRDEGAARAALYARLLSHEATVDAAAETLKMALEAAQASAQEEEEEEEEQQQGGEGLEVCAVTAAVEAYMDGQRAILAVWLEAAEVAQARLRAGSVATQAPEKRKSRRRA